MNYTETGVIQQQKVKVKNLLPEIGIEWARKEIIAGLTSDKPYISSKYFYDELGSKLFEEITGLKEYYPTRTEKGILWDAASDLIKRGAAFEVIEIGSGDCSKISILLQATNHLENVKYIPVDFSRSAIEDSANQLSERYPELEIEGYVADFIHQIPSIPHSEKPRIVCFLGSTIGNFEKGEAKDILINLSKGLVSGDSLLIGFDLVKDVTVLNGAYNDVAGVTAKFNKNILSVVTRLIESDFNLDDFDHLSFFNEGQSRIEMHLVANKSCIVHSPFLKNPISFKRGDSIHTENSHKFTLESISEIIAGTGLSIKNIYTDNKEWFALLKLTKMS